MSESTLCPACQARETACYNFSMNFEDRVSGIVADGLARKAEEKRLEAEFRSGWGEARKLVFVVCREAQMGCEQHFGLLAKPGPSNGCERFEIETEDTGKCSLFFSPDFERRVIAVTADGLDSLRSEDYALELLDRDTIEEKVAEFVTAVMGHPASHRRFTPAA